MSNVLLVPIHLDALCLHRELTVLRPQADFSRLPYWDKEETRHINHDVANLSEELTARPFEDRGLHLKKGVHLHWALPDALTKGVVERDRTSFPTVPNRWLVSRSKARRGRVNQWIVESDYVHTDKEGELSGSVAIPFPAEKGHPPFRYLGRMLPRGDWEELSNGQYLGNFGYQLTAVGYEYKGQPEKMPELSRGYSEPTFAAFYPNCHSVFGFHDEETPARGVTYDVLGWYSDPNQDYLKVLIDRARQQNAGKTITELVKEACQWKMPDAYGGGEPDQTMFYASLTVDIDKLPHVSRDDKPVTVAVGNTSTQALSAYLAHTLHKDLGIGKSTLEEQLEALHYGSRLTGKKSDFGPKFNEARHERGFSAVDAGSLWFINQAGAESKEAPLANAAGKPVPEPLPNELVDLLNSLNHHQAAYDHTGQELESMRQQLFADWHRYMTAAYPIDDPRELVDIDEARHFIEKNDLLPVNRLQARRNAHESQCRQLHAELTKKVEDLAQQTKQPWKLQQTSAPRYWRPTEPVLLIVDDELSATSHKHGRRHHEGLLQCYLSPKERDSRLHRFPIFLRREAIMERIDQIPVASGPVPGDIYTIDFHTDWKNQPWHPLLLEWQVEVMALNRKNSSNKVSQEYSQDFITSNYRLGETAVDFKARSGESAVRNATRYISGSSLLSSHARLQLQKEIEAYSKSSDSQNSPIAKTIDLVSKELNKPAFHARAQALSGFNDALLMHKQTMQLPIADPLGFPNAQSFTSAVRVAVAQTSYSAPQPRNDFNPIRTGVLEIHRLRIVDTFGRVQKLSMKDHKVMTTEIMAMPSHPHWVFLPPRLVQAARLNFRWMAAETVDVLEGDGLDAKSRPAATPICGWFLPNNLDSSLMVYDTAGKPLGSITASVADDKPKWIPAPGTSIVPDGQWNTHLRDLVNHLLHMPEPADGKSKFLLDFLESIEVALEQIDPENFLQHEALALLIGRPIAVVRAMVNLELKGKPAINQSWDVFRADIQRDLEQERTELDGGPTQPTERGTDSDGNAFEKVHFPIRLGDDHQLNDGLVGYWKESKGRNADKYEENRFYVHASDSARVPEDADLSKLPLIHKQLSLTDKQQTWLSGYLRPGKPIRKRKLLSHLENGEAAWKLLSESRVIHEVERNRHIHYAAETPDLAQSLADPPQMLTMLIDPRGVVHATCGILPAKAIGIPTDQYQQALRTLQLTFQCGPILTGDEVNLPLPDESGYAWSWLENRNGAWSESPPGPVTHDAAFSQSLMIREGWLKLTESKE